MSLPDLAFAATAGMLATINPCAFPLLPGFAAYFVGADGEATPQPLPTRILRGLGAGLAVAAGFAATFALAAVVVALGGKPLLAYAHWLAWVVAGGLIVLGLAMLAGHTLHLPLAALGRGTRRRGVAGMLGYGVAYGAASLSCTLPIFLLVVGGALLAGSMLGTLVNFLAYALGMAVVLVAVAVAAALGQGALAAGLRQLLPSFQRLAGALVTAGGIWLLYVQASAVVVA